MKSLGAALVCLLSVAVFCVTPRTFAGGQPPLVGSVTQGENGPVAFRHVVKPAELLVQKIVTPHGTGGFLVESKNFTVSITLYNVGESPAETIVLEDTWDKDLFEIVDGAAKFVVACEGNGKSCIAYTCVQTLLSLCYAGFGFQRATCSLLSQLDRVAIGTVNPMEKHVHNTTMRVREQSPEFWCRGCVSPRSEATYVATRARLSYKAGQPWKRK